MRSRTFLPAVCYLLLIALVYTVTASSGEFDLEADLVHLARVDPQAAWKLIELATAESAVSPRTTTPWQAVQFQSVPVIPACQYPNTIPTNPVVQDGTTSGTRLFSNVEHEHLHESEHNHDHQDHSFEIIYVAHVHDDNGQMTTYEVRFVPAAERAFDSLQNANPTRLFDLHGVTLDADGPTQVLLVSHIDSSLRQKTTPRQTSTNPRDRTWITYNPRRVGLDLRVLVINVDFSDAPSAVDLPTIATDMFRDSVNPVYLRSSFGQAYFGTVDVTPVLRMPDPRQFYASATSNLYYLFQDGPGAAEAAGYDFFSYDYWVVLTDVGGFPYGGLGYIGWSGALVFSAYDTLVEHELGHNFNMWHANGWIVNQGDPRPYGNGFNAEYNDFYDIMGFGARDFNVEEKIAAGWSAREQAVIAVDPSASNYIEIHDVGTFEKFFHYPAIPKLVVQVPRLVVEAPGTGDFYHLSFRNVTGSFGGYLQFTYSETNSEHDTKIVQAIPYRDTPYGPISNQALPRGYTLTDEPNQIHLTTLHSNHGNGVSNVAVVYHPTDVADASSQLSASWDLVYSPVQITSYAPISIRGIHAGGAAVSVSALGMQADLLDQGGNDPVLFVSPSHSGPEPGVLAFVSNLCGSEIQSFQHVQGADTTYEPPRLIFFKPTGGSQEVTFTFPPYEFAHSDFPKGLMRFQVRMTDTLPWSAITQLELWTNHGKVMDIYRICEVCEDNVEIEMTSKFLPQGLTQILLLARHKSGIWVSSAPFSVVMTTTNGFEYTPPPASDIVCHAPWTPPPPFPGGQHNSGALTAATSLSAAAVLALIVAACL